MAKITPRRKVALDNPAEVLTLAQRLGERLKPYATWLLVAGAAVVVALGAWGINARMQAGREAKAAEALQEVTPKVDLKVPAAETVPSLEKFIQEHPGTKAAREAQLLRANLLYRSQQYTQAAQAYEALLPGPDPGWAILVKESLSYCYEGMGDFQKAAATLKSVVDQVSGPGKLRSTGASCWISLPTPPWCRISRSAWPPPSAGGSRRARACRPPCRSPARSGP